MTIAIRTAAPQPEPENPSPLESFSTWYERRVDTDPRGAVVTADLFANYRLWAAPREFPVLDLRSFVQQLEAKGAIRAARDTNARDRTAWRVRLHLGDAPGGPIGEDDADARLIARIRLLSLHDAGDVDVVSCLAGEDSNWRVAIYFRAERWRLHPAQAVILAGRLNDEPLDHTAGIADRLARAACQCMFREVEASRLSQAEVAARKLRQPRRRRGGR